MDEVIYITSKLKFLFSIFAVFGNQCNDLSTGVIGSRFLDFVTVSSFSSVGDVLLPSVAVHTKKYFKLKIIKVLQSIRRVAILIL